MWLMEKTQVGQWLSVALVLVEPPLVLIHLILCQYLSLYECIRVESVCTYQS